MSNDNYRPSSILNNQPILSHSDSIMSLNALGLKNMELPNTEKDKQNYKEKFQNFLNMIQQESEINLKKYENISKRIMNKKGQTNIHI